MAVLVNPFVFAVAEEPGGGSPTLVGEAEAYPTSNSAVNVTLPAGSAAGDVCVVACISDKTYSALPSGFTQLGFDNAQDNIEIRTSYRVLDSTNITNGYVTVPGDPNFNGIRYQVWVVTGGDLDVNAVSSGVDLTGSNSVNTMPSVTTTAADDLVLVACGGRDVGSTWSSVSGDLTTDQSSTTGFVAMYAGHYTAGAAGPTGTRTATNTGAAYQRWGSTAVALKGAA